MTVAKPKYVWWDMDSCEVPDGCDPNEIRWNIESALVKCYGPGPLTIFAIGNSRRVPPHVLEAMSRSGIIINHTPIGVSAVATNLIMWVTEHTPPAILMIISDPEPVYQNCLVKYEALGYTITRAYLNPPLESPKYTCNVWLWKSLLTQENTRHELLGKCNETAWRCRLCFIDGQGFEDFTSHLDSGEHALKELLLLPHSDFMEEPSMPPHKGWLEALFLANRSKDKGGEDAVKYPDKQEVRIGWFERLLEKKQLKAPLDPVKQESHMVTPDCAAGPNQRDAGTLPNKGGEDALKDPVKQELRIVWFERRREKKQLKALEILDPVKQELHMVSRDWSAGPSEKDSLDFSTHKRRFFLEKELKAKHEFRKHALKATFFSPDHVKQKSDWAAELLRDLPKLSSFNISIEEKPMT